MANRNFWDPNTPTGFTDVREKRRVVELCLYSFEHSKKDKLEARADVVRAAAIWCQSGINVQASHWERLPEFTGPGSVDPIDLNFPSLAEELLCGGLVDDVGDQFFNIGLPHSPKPSEDNDSTDPSDIATQCIPVYYIPGKRFQDGFGSGCHRQRGGSIEGPPEHMILLTDEADGGVLAHELGHALLTREEGAGNWINDDPDPSQDPNDPIHNLKQNNLTSPRVQ